MGMAFIFMMALLLSYQNHTAFTVQPNTVFILTLFESRFK